MRKSIIAACLLATLALAGCAGAPRLPVATVTVPSAAAAAAMPTPAATATPQPSATARLQPSPSPTATPPPCLAAVTPRPQPRVQPLRSVYADGGKLWLWKEEAGTATPYALGGEAYDARVSSDGRLLAFRRPAGERVDEIWLVGTDGAGERRLVTVSAEGTFQRYPDALEARLTLDWVPATHTVAYCYALTFQGLGAPPYDDTVRLVNADTGNVQTVRAHGFAELAYAPDGRQYAVLAGPGRIIATGDGRVLYSFPEVGGGDCTGCFSYSPDGRYVAAFAQRSIAVVEAANGARRDIPFDYRPIGMGEYSVYPRIAWLAGAPVFHTAFSDGDAMQVLGKDATFTLWRVDVAAGTATPVDTYRGSFLGSSFSPDGRWLAYPVRLSNNHCQLYLVDVQSGHQVLYAEGGWIGLRGWSPDSTRFVYQQAGVVTLGHICGAPRPLAGVDADSQLGWYDSVCWVDTERFLTVKGSRQAEQWTVKLNAADGKVTTIATLHAYKPSYGYYVEQ